MDEKTVIIKKGSFGSFVRGAMIGAGLALLLAPRSGRETREILSDRGMEFRDKASEIARDTRSRAQTYISDARNKLNDTMRGVKDGIAEGSSEANKELKRELEIMEDMNNPHFNL